MVKIITGKKGSGKTKVLIDMINAASKNTDGYVVCIDKSDKLRYDIPHSVRIVDTDVSSVYSFEAFYGLIAGLVAGNYDIKEIFVDSILKIGGADFEALGALLAKVDKLTADEVHVVLTVSADLPELPESVAKFAEK
ncbi:MAG: ATP-binding protein [Oscillospiraceae bacterium]|nr:ATP-binding protein [Oscillospiraceae bacterium]